MLAGWWANCSRQRREVTVRLVAEFGYVIALMRSGVLLREQFFNPRKFHPSLALRHQMLFGGTMPTAPEERIWTNPFSFTFENGACSVGARNFAVIVPVSAIRPYR